MIFKKYFIIICILIGTHQIIYAAEDGFYEAPEELREPFKKFVELSVPFFTDQLDRSKYETLKSTGEHTTVVGHFLDKKYGNDTRVRSRELDQKFRENSNTLFPTDLCTTCRRASYFEKDSVASINIDDFRHPVVWDSFRFTVMHKFLQGYLFEKMVNNWQKYTRSAPRPSHPLDIFDTAPSFPILTGLQTGFYSKEDALYSFSIDSTDHILNKINVLSGGSELYYAFKLAEIIRDNPNKETAIEAIRQFVLETRLAEDNEGFLVIF